jgi:hypothetical protein
LINNVVSSNEGVLIADIYIRTTVYINLKNIPHSPREPRGIVKGQGSTKVIMDMQHTTLWICTHIPNIIDISRKKQLFDLEIKGQHPNKGHYGTRVNMVRDTPLMVMHPHIKYH